MSFVFDSVSDWYKTQELCEKVVSKDAFMLEYCLDRYKTQEMCDKEVDAFLSTLKFIAIGSLQLKRLKNLMIIYSAMII